LELPSLHYGIRILALGDCSEQEELMYRALA